MFSNLSRTNFEILATFQSLPNNNIVDKSKLKTFADDKMLVNVDKNLKLIWGRVQT